MERSVAIKKLGKLIGKGLGYRVNAKAPTKEERETAKAEYAVALKERNELKEKRRRGTKPSLRQIWNTKR